MKNVGLTLAALYLAFAPQAQAGINFLEQGAKFTCSQGEGSNFYLEVEVLKQLKSDNFLDDKFKVKISEGGPRLDPQANVIYSTLMTSPIQTRTMAGAYYQTVLRYGKILSLTNLMYSIFKDKPVGFTGKIHDLKHGYETPVKCHFIAIEPTGN